MSSNTEGAVSPAKKNEDCGELRDGNNFEGKDLSGCNIVKERIDFSKCNFKGAILTGANLEGANLTNATLTKAILNSANLTGAYLGFANLTGADLTKAILTGANLTDANLEGADLERANLTGAYLFDANLTGAKLTGANLEGVDLTDANLEGADLERANLTGAYLFDADLERANLTGANLNHANLTDANLEGANLTYANLEGAILTGANLEGANLTGTILDPARRQLRHYGIAFEIHNAFTDFPLDSYIIAISKYVDITETDYHGEITAAETRDIFEYVIDKLKNGLSGLPVSQLDRIKRDICESNVLPEVLNAILLTVEFIFNKTDKEFQDSYRETYIKDCFEAYNRASVNPGDELNTSNLSCVKGMIERLILSIREPLISYCSKDKNTVKRNKCTPAMNDLYYYFVTPNDDEVEEIRKQALNEWACSILSQYPQFAGREITKAELKIKKNALLLPMLEQILNLKFRSTFGAILRPDAKENEIESKYKVFYKGVIEMIRAGEYAFPTLAECTESQAGGSRKRRIKSKRRKSGKTDKTRKLTLRTKKRKAKRSK